MATDRDALRAVIDALEEIALAGMSGSGQESEEGMRDWHARQAWKFIGIAARALEPARAALAAPPVEQQAAEPELWKHKKTGGIYEWLMSAVREEDQAAVVVYRSRQDGVRWVRPSVDFYDGRFEKIAGPQSAQPAPQAGAAVSIEEYRRLVARCVELGEKLVTKQTVVVAWMHDEPGRVDVIHHKVKELLEDQHAKGYSSPDYMHRPLGKVEHYTIPLYAHPDATEEFVGYLCCAWGESDRPVAELVRDLESVGRFMVKHWLGDEGAEDYDGTPTLPRLMTEWQDHDWDNEWSADFEIGGVSVERLHCAVPAARADQAQGESKGGTPHG